MSANTGFMEILLPDVSAEADLGLLNLLKLCYNKSIWRLRGMGYGISQGLFSAGTVFGGRGCHIIGSISGMGALR